MKSQDLSRRDFVKTTGAAGAGLVIAFNIPWFQGCAGPPPIPVEGGMQPNSYIRIDPEGAWQLKLARELCFKGLLKK